MARKPRKARVVRLAPALITLRFLNADMRRVIAEAVTQHCCLALVRADSVYWQVDRRTAWFGGQPVLVAYSEGCDPACAPYADWLARARTALGLEPGIERFDPHERIFQWLLTRDDDLDVCVQSDCLLLRAVPARRDGL